MRFSTILVRTSEETVAAFPPRLSRSFAWLLHADGPPGRACHSTSFIGYGYVRHSGLSFALQPPQIMSGNKWTIRDRALPANSKQISLSIEAPLNSGTSCMVRDGNWATTHDSTLFGQEVCPYFPPGSPLVFTLIVFSLSVPKQQEVHPSSSERTGDS